MTQVVCCSLLTVEARVRIYVSPRRIFGRQSSSGTGFFLNPSVFPSPCHPTGAPYSCIIWGMNNRPIDGHSSETISSHWHEQHDHNYQIQWNLYPLFVKGPRKINNDAGEFFIWVMHRDQRKWMIFPWKQYIWGRVRNMLFLAESSTDIAAPSVCEHMYAFWKCHVHKSSPDVTAY
jgi:hypothetical protein